MLPTRAAVYLLTTAMIALMGLAHAVFSDEASPYFGLALVVFFAALLAGPRAGMLAGLLSAPLGLFFLRSGGIAPHEWVQCLLFCVSAIVIVGMGMLDAALAESVRRSAAEGGAIQRRADQLAQELELLIDSASNYAIYMLDPQGRVVIWNKGAERIFGWDERDVLGQPDSVFFAPDEIAAGTPHRQLAKAQATGRLEERGWRMRKDGSEFLASVTISAISDATGRAVGFGKVVRDITDEQAYAESIEARETLLHSILSTVPDAMVVIDDKGMITSFSTAAERLFGYAQDEAVGQNVSLLTGSADHETDDEYLARYRATGERPIIGGGGQRVLGRRRDGTTFPHELAIGEAVGGGKRVFAAFMRDLSAREAAEARVRELQAELLHVSRVSAMGTMASTLAHELNQPLTAVANYVQTSLAMLDLPDGDTGADVREALVEAGAEALRAGHIVRRLREFVAHGEVSKSIEQVPRLIEDACMLGFAGTSERGIVHRLDLDPDIGSVLIDRVQIQQVLINLIRNAVEAMAPAGTGEVRIIVRKENEFARVTVADTGPGLAPGSADQFFQAFVSTKCDGMGLGLSICRTIVEAHGGKIWAEASATGGAMFHFTVPRALTEEVYG